MMPLTTQAQDTIYQLAAQMMEQATGDADRARIDRALDLVGHVERTVQPGMWLVYSATDDTTAYIVKGRTCSCPDYQKRGEPCKHHYAVQLFNRLERTETDAEEGTMLTVDRLPQIPTYSTHPNGIIGAIVEYLDPALYAEKFPAIAITVDPEDEAIPYWPTDGEPCDLPAQCARCHAEPQTHHRDGLGMACIAAELGMEV